MFFNPILSLLICVKYFFWRAPAQSVGNHFSPKMHPLPTGISLKGRTFNMFRYCLLKDGFDSHLEKGLSGVFFNPISSLLICVWFYYLCDYLHNQREQIQVWRNTLCLRHLS